MDRQLYIYIDGRWCCIGVNRDGSTYHKATGQGNCYTPECRFGEIIDGIDPPQGIC